MDESSKTPQSEIGSSSAPTATPEVEVTPTSQPEATPSSQPADTPTYKKKFCITTSNVRNDFERISGDKVVCKHCKKPFDTDSGKNGTSSMNNHLKTCPENPNKKTKGQQQLMFPPPRPGDDSKMVSLGFIQDKCRRM
ncbi:hypothetical protein MKX01_021367 [Papaver californicum]|nr:hypothetical protein MKX01_021367 [Papaver californicum]